MKTKVFKSVLICSALIVLVSCSESKKEPVWHEVYTKQGLEVVKADSANILVHLRYSTTDNFLGRMYTEIWKKLIYSLTHFLNCIKLLNY